MSKLLGIVVLGLTGLGLAWSSLDQEARRDGEELAKVLKEIEALDRMRSSLAGSFKGEPDQQTFAQVCMPVGKQAKQLAEENGWKVQQLAFKYRNPANKLDEEAASVYRMMLEDPGAMGLWISIEKNGQAGMRYFRRIVIEEACLACHGAKDARPQFIKDGYPEDRAFDFQVGDLRGLYSVFVSD